LCFQVLKPESTKIEFQNYSFLFLPQILIAF
jgi:hypothetical protein